MPMKNANPQIEESEALRKKALREVAATKEVIEESRQILDKTQQTLDEVRAKRQPRGGGIRLPSESHTKDGSGSV